MITPVFDIEPTLFNRVNYHPPVSVVAAQNSGIFPEPHSQNQRKKMATPPGQGWRFSFADAA